MTDFEHWMRAIQRQMETTLSAVLPPPHHAPQRLHESMHYAVLGGGKRVRPLLVLAAGDLSHASEKALYAAAAAVELIHAYSLVHDDLPCMDDDVLRRGKPTCHVAFDEATALLAGDALQTRAFEVLSAPDLDLTPAQQITMLRTLAQASGAAGMAGGQAIDLSAVGRQLNLAELELMHTMKTGALIRAAILLGVQAGQPQSDADIGLLDHFARRMGLAFQVVDDILDCEADSQTLGKTAGKDAANEKPTYVSLMGLSEARRFAQELREEAFAALAPFGARADRLRALADYIVARHF